MVKVVLTGALLTVAQVVERAKKCERNGLCFISLAPLEGVEAVAVDHPHAGSVRIHPKYA